MFHDDAASGFLVLLSTVAMVIAALVRCVLHQEILPKLFSEFLR